jgi:L-malate glycosyltransferase
VSQLQAQPGAAGAARRPRILFTNFHPRDGGGHVTYIRNLCSSDLAQRYELAIASPATSTLIRYAREAGIRHYPLEFPGNFKEIAGVLASVVRLGAVYRQFPFDLIHTNGSRDHRIAAYWKLLTRKPPALLRTRHAVKRVSDDFLHRLLDLKLTAANVFVSRTARRLCEGDGALGLTNGRVIANGVDLDRFHPIPKDQELARQIGLAPGDLVFGSAAGLGAYKRVDLMLKAIAQDVSAEPIPTRSIKVVILGDSDSARRLQALAHSLGLGNRFIYAGQQNDVRPFIALFDVGFVLSDAIETISFAAREMMAMGVPLVSSSFSGLVENVDHGLNGLLVRPGDLDEVKQAVQRFAAMPTEELARFSAEARRKAEREFSLSTQIDLTDRLYREVLAATAGGGAHQRPYGA